MVHQSKVQRANELYKDRSDLYNQFIKETIEEVHDPTAKLGLEDAFLLYKTWCKESLGIHYKADIKIQFKEILISRWGELNSTGQWINKKPKVTPQTHDYL